MDKIGHLVMTKSLSGNIHRAHKAALFKTWMDSSLCGRLFYLSA